MRTWVALFGLVLAACQQAPQPQGQATPAERLDPFIIMIDAERWGVLIDRAMEAVHEHVPFTEDTLENEVLRADRATKDGAIALLALRNEICGRGLIPAADCALDVPAWVHEAPTAATPLAVIDDRSQWLGTAMDKYVAYGCEQGRVRTGEDMYCSVE